MNKLILAGATATLLALSGIAAGAQQIAVRVNGEPVMFEGAGPREYQGRVLVPLRGVLEKLGAYVDWIPSTQTVVATKGDLDMQLPIGANFARVNGRRVPLDVPAMTVGGSTMVPLRFVSETLGAEVHWNSATATVSIETSGRIAENPPSREPRGDGFAYRRRTPVVTSVLTNLRDSYVHPGEMVHVRMHATPGGKAFFRIRGMVGEVKMNEISPGVYEGDWRADVAQSMAVDNHDILAFVTVGDIASPETPASGTFRRYGGPEPISTGNVGNRPRIVDITPTPGERIARFRPTITANFNLPYGGRIAVNRVRLMIDGRDVTDEANVSTDGLTWTPDRALAEGSHTVEVIAYDRDGNSARRTWNFFVQR